MSSRCRSGGRLAWTGLEGCAVGRLGELRRYVFPQKSSSSALTGEIESEVLVGGSSVQGALLVRRSREECEG